MKSPPGSGRSTPGRCSSSSPRRCSSSTFTTTSSTTSSGGSRIRRSRSTCSPERAGRCSIRAMRNISFAFALLFGLAGIAAGQDWADYQNIQDGFKIDFPGQPKVTETTWTSEYGYKLPARVYSAERGKERYSMTVVDYNPIEAQGIERRKNCPAGAEPCIGSDLSGPGYWRHDIRGAIVYATSKFLERDVKMTRMLWAHEDRS